MNQKSIFETTCGRCGTHWVKYILSQTLGFKIELPNVHSFKKPAGRQVEYPKAILNKEQSDPGGYIYTYHVPIHNLHVIKDSVNIIVLVRDPRDSCVSSVHYDIMNGYFNKKEFDKVLQHRLDAGGQYPEFFQSYLEHRHSIPHLVLRYEDVIKDTYGSIKTALNKLKYEFLENDLRKAIQNNKFEKLSGGRKKGDEKEDHHYRKGIVGDWKNYLSYNDNYQFVKKHGHLMEALGYEC